MNARPKDSNVPSEPPSAAEVISFAKFLSDAPPDTRSAVRNVAEHNGRIAGGYCVARPDIELPCSSDKCASKGAMTYSRVGEEVQVDSTVLTDCFVNYVCCNCSESFVTFAISVSMNKGNYDGVARKYGQNPPYGDNLPSRVFSLVGPDKDLFLKGRRAENLGLGIGAFEYYRRVVDNQKNRVIKALRQVAERTGADEEHLKIFDRALIEVQFSKVIDMLGPAIPSSLKIKGHNPLALLYSDLSNGVHDGTDEECLILAREVRVVMAELAERVDAALKDNAELESAVVALAKRHAERKAREAEKAKAILATPKTGAAGS